MSINHSRKAELEAKKARLEELRKQRLERIGNRSSIPVASHSISSVDVLVDQILQERTQESNEKSRPIQPYKEASTQVDNLPEQFDNRYDIPVVEERIIFNKSVQTEDIDWEVYENGYFHRGQGPQEGQQLQQINLEAPQSPTPSDEISDREIEQEHPFDPKLTEDTEEPDDPLVSSLVNSLRIAEETLQKKSAKDKSCAENDESLQELNSHDLLVDLELFDQELTESRPILSIDWSPHNRTLIAVSYAPAVNSISSQGMVILWNTKSPNSPETILKYTSPVSCVQFAKHASNIVIGGTVDGRLCIWDLKNLDLSHYPTQLSINDPSSGLYTGSITQIVEISSRKSFNTTATDVVTASASGVIATWSIHMLSSPVSTPIRLLGNNSQSIHSNEPIPASAMICLPSDAGYLLVGCEDGFIYRVRRFESMGLKAGIESRLKAHGIGLVTSLSFPQLQNYPHETNDFSKIFISSGLDFSIKVHRLTAHSIEDYDLDGSILQIPTDFVIMDLAFRPGFPLQFVAVGNSGSIDLYDLSEKSALPIINIFPSQQKASKKGDYIKETYDSFDELNDVSIGFNRASWDSSGAYLATAGLNGKVYILKFQNQLAKMDLDLDIDHTRQVTKLQALIAGTIDF
ncbi:BA75_03991T0 [Komagataella pastoris]|uniref:BA75_03991T0 n=1 Tax=Komagataella pastoris TaxID=4922 RepID=A0A1B2JEL4_PICPA|nr:BA75_03991T0 [Komagataella pastoris]